MRESRREALRAIRARMLLGMHVFVIIRHPHRRRDLESATLSRVALQRCCARSHLQATQVRSINICSNIHVHPVQMAAKQKNMAKSILTGFYEKRDGPAQSMTLSKRARLDQQCNVAATENASPIEMPPVLPPELVDCTWDDIKANLADGEFQVILTFIGKC